MNLLGAICAAVITLAVSGLLVRQYVRALRRRAVQSVAGNITMLSGGSVAHVVQAGRDLHLKLAEVDGTTQAPEAAEAAEARALDREARRIREALRELAERKGVSAEFLRTFRPSMRPGPGPSKLAEPSC